MKQDIKSRTIEQLQEEFSLLSLPRFRAGQVYAWLHQKGARSFEEMTNLPKDLRAQLDGRYYINRLEVERLLVSKVDGTEKYLLRLGDGNCIEAVLMEYHHGNTLCISTQVGCRMGCKFCASTLGGLVRNLTASEMLDEVYTAERVSGRTVGGVVLMGIGEPLDNFDNVVAFMTILSSKEGRNLSLRHLSLSTCGLVPEIERLAQYRFPLTLSISLHAPQDVTRRQIMPIANRYPLKELMAACERYFAETGRRISFEYALIAGQNDTPAHAKELAKLLGGKNCHINLIPVNEVKERAARRPQKAAVEAFRASLERAGLNATVRRELGSDIAAACGQLRRESARQTEQKEEL